MRGTSVAMARALALLALLAPAAASLAGQSRPPRPAADPQTCVVLAAPPRQSSKKDEPQQSPQIPHPTVEEAVAKPISEGEVLELIETLEAAKGAATERRSKRARCSPDRLRVVLDDVTTLLVSVHAREALRQLEAAGRPGAEIRQWLEGQVSTVESCVSGRYEGRGGAAAHQASLALVEKHRSKLESLVLGLGRWVPAGPAAALESAR